MGRYIARRLLQMIPVFIGVTFIIYTLTWALPGDPFAGRCGERPCPPAVVGQLTAKYHLDDPLLVQYGHYMANLIQGDFGDTFRGRPVLDEIKQALPTTAKLAVLAISIEILIGISAGLLAGIRRGSFIDNLVLLSTLVVISIPVFVVGYTLQYIVGVKWGVLPATVPPGDTSVEALLLPAFVLASLSLAYIARLTRTSLMENLRADYVRTAVAKGLARRRVVGKHVLRNSLIPVVTYLGLDFGALLGGAIVTEYIFNINGIGGLTARAIRLREGLTVTGVVTVLVLMFLLINLLVDLLYAWLDPRIRYE